MAREKLRQWDLGTLHSVQEDIFAIGYHYTLCCYSHIQCTKLLADLVLLTGTIIIIDNGTKDLLSLQEFGRRLFAGLPQLHPALERITEIIFSVGAYYPSFSANIMVSDTVNYFAGESLRCAVWQPVTMEYANLVRAKVGYGETSAAFIWPKSQFMDMGMYIQALP